MSSTSDSGVSLSDVKLDKVDGYNTTSDQPVSVAPVQALASPEILQVYLQHKLPLLILFPTQMNQICFLFCALLTRTIILLVTALLFHLFLLYARLLNDQITKYNSST